MVACELVNVLELPVEIQGGIFAVPARNDWSKKGGYRNVGGYAVEWASYESGLGRVEMRENGRDMPTSRVIFATAADAEAEYRRLESLLWTREWVAWVTSALNDAGIVPAEFFPAIRSGDAVSLLVAADLQDGRGRSEAAILLRAAYHRIDGTANVAVRAGKGKVIVLNPIKVTPKYPAKPEVGGCRAAVIEEGKSITILHVHARSGREPGTNQWKQFPSAVETSTFAIGSQAEYDSYNLVYFGPIESITAKTIVIDASHRGKKRLAIGAFVGKNYDFDLAAAQKRNDDWTD